MSNYYDEQANQWGRSISDIELNGGVGSSAWWNAQHQQQAARQQSEHWNRSSGYGQTSTPIVSPSPVYIPHYTGPGPATQPWRTTTRPPSSNSGSLLLGLVKLLLIGVWGWLAWWAWHTGEALLPRTPVGSYLFDVPPMERNGQTDPMWVQLERQVNARGFADRYGSLFKQDTPWNKALPACPERSRNLRCAYPTHATVSALVKSHAQNPERFWTDFCTASLDHPDSYHWLIRMWPTLTPYLSLPIAPDWVVREIPAKMRFLGSHQCVLRNAQAMEQAIQDIRPPFMLVVQGVTALLLLMMLPTYWWLRRINQKRPGNT